MLSDGREGRAAADPPASKITARVEVGSGPDERRSGKLELTWLDASTWKQELSLGDYRRTLTVMRGSRWIEQNASYRPLWTFDLDRLLEFDGGLLPPLSDTSTEGWTRVGALDRIELESERGPVVALDDPETGALRQLSYIETLAPGLTRRSEYHYGKAIDFAGRRLPVRMVMRVGSRAVVVINLEMFEPLPAGTPTFDRPAGIPTNVTCERTDPAVEIESRSPHAPSEDNGLVVRFVVSKNGSLHDFAVLNPHAPRLEASLVDRLALESWLPERCDGAPVDSMAIVAGNRTITPPD